MSRGDWIDDPDVLAWAKDVTENLIPMLRESAVTVSLVPSEAGRDDVKMAVELGMTIMLGKPLILAVLPGRQIPAKLVAIADEIVELDDLGPAAQARLAAAIERVTGPE